MLLLLQIPNPDSRFPAKKHRPQADSCAGVVETTIIRPLSSHIRPIAAGHIHAVAVATRMPTHAANE
ncbi:MAG: hypothetical protein EPN71_08175 [Rhodanobacter sp.]|nr:MAG: hypothetical protein EPN71_08175 [Rhodanobacter sp.]